MAPPTFTPADRIRELSEINADVALMLGAAGQAVNALTNRNPDSSDQDTQMTDDASDAIEAHKKAFMENTETYFTSLQSVFARLRRQAYALEEAGITVPDSAPLSLASGRAAQPTAAQKGPNYQAPPRAEERIKNGGLGNFDVGHLNSRGNKVGEEKEAELIQEAKELINDN